MAQSANIVLLLLVMVLAQELVVCLPVGLRLSIVQQVGYVRSTGARASNNSSATTTTHDLGSANCCSGKKKLSGVLWLREPLKHQCSKQAMVKQEAARMRVHLQQWQQSLFWHPKVMLQQEEQEAMLQQEQGWAGHFDFFHCLLSTVP